jgi:rhodanese-related sulfurtransferase
MLWSKSDEAKRKKIESFYDRSRRQFPEVPEISAEELRERLGSEELVIVDVRAPEEQEVSMIEGAIPSREFEQNMSEYEGSAVVCYCTIGHRSGLYAQHLQRLGWDAHNLKGAILSWTHAGGELVNADGPTRKVHVWSPRTSLEADGYEPVW